jgi:gamma-glutamyltranspeptidase/glutathione hydrolase
MLYSQQATGGMVVASHHLAAQAGLEVLRDGGNAVEAMVSAAATIGVVYPHMNGLGGDGFWLIHEPGRDAPLAISAIGAACAAVEPELYRRRGLDAIPTRGPLAANTVAATVAGWKAALDHAQGWGAGLPLARLLEPAIHYARDGYPVSGAQHRGVADSRAELADVYGWADTFLNDGAVPETGGLFKQPALAETLARLAEAGLDDFYRGGLARTIAADLARAECPVSAADLAGQQVEVGAPLSLSLASGTAFNLPPPTQGVVSLILLGLFDRLAIEEADGFDHVHGAVEAVKRAFLVRNAQVTDPKYMTTTAEDLLGAETLDRLAAEIDRAHALPWPAPGLPGDTVWLAAGDAAGRVVSFIHSIYWHFGSAVVLRDTGIQWQNRGSSFSLDPEALQYLRPGRLPFHTNNPAMTYLNDGRVMAYGAMGGDGQPQTQAAIFTRYALYGQGLQQAVTAPRWLLGRTWGDERDDLRVEGRFPPDLIAALRQAGHQVQVVADFDAVMGHAGALVSHPGGVLEGAGDPRSDGAVACF